MIANGMSTLQNLSCVMVHAAVFAKAVQGFRNGSGRHGGSRTNNL